MADKKENGMGPDISGVFHIDDDSVPSTVIYDRPAPKPETPAPVRQHVNRQSAEERRRRADSSAAQRRSAAREDWRRSQGLSAGQAEDAPAPAHERRPLPREDRETYPEAPRGARGLRPLLPLLVVALLAGAAFLGFRWYRALPRVTLCYPETETLDAYAPRKVAVLTMTDESGAPRLYAVCLSTPEAPLEKGQKVLFAEDAAASHTGSVTQITQADANGALILKLATLLPESRIAPGANTVALILPDEPGFLQTENEVRTVSVSTASERGLTLPLSVMHQEADGWYVWLYTHSGVKRSVKRQPVKTGLVTETKAVITDGLEEGAAVAKAFSVSDDALKDGMSVLVQKETPTAAATTTEAAPETAAPSTAAPETAETASGGAPETGTDASAEPDTDAGSAGQEAEETAQED